jgi:hypothetical protein
VAPDLHSHKGSRAFKHWCYTAEHIAEQRELMALLRDMNGLVEQVDDED